MGRALHALGLFCARRSLVMIGVWVVSRGPGLRLRRQVRRRDQQRPDAAGHREPGGQGPARGPLPAAAERHQPDRLRRQDGQADRQGEQEGHQRVDQGDGEGAARLQRDQPDQQRRPDGRPAVEGRADRVRPRAARHRLRRPRRGDRAGGLRHHRAGAGRRDRGRRRPARSAATLSEQPTREQRGRRHPRRDAHPDAGARQPRRDGAADHRGRRRSRRRARDWSG